LTLPSTDWLPLLRRLSRVSASWGVWKNADRALRGQGDIDSVAPLPEHDRLLGEFRRWALDARLQWLIQCEHAGGIHVLIAVNESAWAQLDLVWTSPFRGAQLLSAEDLVPLMTMDPRGFRRVRDGAEGLFLFLYKGIHWGGRSDWPNLRKYGVIDKLARDWAGAEAAATLLGRAGAPMLKAARSAMRGEWDASALFHAEAFTLLRALRDPRLVASRAIARGWRLKRCIVAGAIAEGRQPRRLREWIDEASRNHKVDLIAPAHPGPQDGRGTSEAG
jgi:hypothetical protein